MPEAGRKIAAGLFGLAGPVDHLAQLADTVQGPGGQALQPIRVDVYQLAVAHRRQVGPRLPDGELTRVLGGQDQGGSYNFV